MITVGLILGLNTTQEENVTITVTIDGLRNQNGYVAVALHNGESDFPDDEAFQSQYVEVSKGAIEVVFEDVPAGEYAVAVMHDENGNEEMDFNEYGMPLEGFGFSNEAKAEMGPPGFDEASFSAKEDVEEYIEMMYIGN